ncbi:MAG TPA: transketolase C-terminal domain-containing protein [Candidatus Paceibacterota bacterium]|nr:transketolase C-terminal domain-containing protein [Candidatus Paceibacterota bacterium]
MLNSDLKLAKNIFDTPDMAPTRDGFGTGLVEAGEKDSRVVAVCADLAESTRILAFKEKFPDRYIEAGVAEQNLATVASGLANYGKIPFIASYATFSPGRNNEQIRTTVSINNVPVKIVGSHAGVSVGPDGATHQALEDIALMRVQPRMTVLYPCDREQARKATLAAAEHQGPVYLRLAREKTPIMTTAQTSFEFGKAQLMWQPKDRRKKPDVVVFATGPLLYNALIAARDLEEKLAVVVINIHTIKPLDAATVVQWAKKAGAVVTVEEHQVAGGLGGAIAEVLASQAPVPVEFIGVHDQFGQSGEPAELIAHYHMDAPSIIDAITKVKARKAK